jgi:hypothetical protein
LNLSCGLVKSHAEKCGGKHDLGVDHSTSGRGRLGTIVENGPDLADQNLVNIRSE